MVHWLAFARDAVARASRKVLVPCCLCSACHDATAVDLGHPTAIDVVWLGLPGVHVTGWPDGLLHQGAATPVPRENSGLGR